MLLHRQQSTSVGIMLLVVCQSVLPIFVSETTRGNFFRFGTNVYLDSRMN